MRRIGALGLAVHVSELDGVTSPFERHARAEARPAGAGVPDRGERVPGGRRLLPDHALGRRGPLVVARHGGDGGRARRRATPRSRAGPGSRRRSGRSLPAGQPPSAPGQPGASAAPNAGVFRRVLDAAWDHGGRPRHLRARAPRRRRRARGRRSRSGVRGLGFSFVGGRLERQGTYRYRVRASDGARRGALVGRVRGVVVDRTDPAPPAITPDRRARRRRLVPRRA